MPINHAINHLVCLFSFSSPPWWRDCRVAIMSSSQPSVSLCRVATKKKSMRLSCASRPGYARNVTLARRSYTSDIILLCWSSRERRTPPRFSWFLDWEKGDACVVCHLTNEKWMRCTGMNYRIDILVDTFCHLIYCKIQFKCMCVYGYIYTHVPVYI